MRLLSDGLQFASPATVPGKEYQVVLVKPVTGEVVTAPATLVATVDDTKPRLTGDNRLGYTSPVRLTFSENIQVASFCRDHAL